MSTHMQTNNDKKGHEGMGLLNPVAGIQRKAKSVSTIRKGNRNRKGGRDGGREKVCGWIYPKSVKANGKSKRNGCVS